MSDTLSQDEVDALLKGISDGEIPPEDAPEDRSEARAYDLLGEERSASRQFPGLPLIHDRFTRTLRHALTAMLGGNSTIEVASVEGLRFSVLRNRLEPNVPVCLFRISPLRGQALAAFAPTLIFQLIDRIFGGAGGAPTRAEEREYSTLEISILGRVLDVILAEYALAWAPVSEIECGFHRAEANPGLVSISGPDDMVLLIELACDLGCGAAPIRIGIPYATLEPLRAGLNEMMHHGGGADLEWTSVMTAAVQDSAVEISAELGRTSLSASEVLSLGVGDIVRLETRGGDPLDVRIEGEALIEGVAGMSRGQNAVRIERCAARR